MKLAIMQPYFLPYIGYFQLIAAVDTFIIYDNVKYTKKGWINRNRLLLNGRDAMFSLPLKKDSDYFDIDKRELANEFNPNKLLNQIIGAYRHAPQFKETLPLIEKIIQIPEKNLFFIRADSGFFHTHTHSNSRLHSPLRARTNTQSLPHKPLLIISTKIPVSFGVKNLA